MSEKAGAERPSLDRVHDQLRAAIRQADGRDIQPTAAVLDSQSVKTTEAGKQKGYDAGKQVKGRKWHFLGNTMGMILAVAITPADV